MRTVGPPAVSVSHSSPKHAFESCGIRGRSCGEVGQVGACTVRIGCRVSRGETFEESRRRDTSSCGAWASGKRLDECQQYLLRAGKRLKMASCGRRCRRAGSVARRVQQWGREIGEVRHLTSGGDGQQHWQNQHLEALVAELRRERDYLRSNGAASKRAGEVGPDRSDVVPEALEELPR